MRSARPFIVLLLAVAAWVVPTAGPAEAVSKTLTIAEVYGGGGGVYKRDYVVIHNRSATKIVLKGMSLQYSPDGGQTWQVTPLAGSLASHHYYLVAEGTAALTGLPLPAPDESGTSNLATSGGLVALVDGVAPLGCGTSCHAGASVVDFVGYGTAKDFEGKGPAPANSLTRATKRNNQGRADTDNNAVDFSSGQPDPRNRDSAPYSPAPSPSPSPSPSASPNASATASATASASPTASATTTASPTGTTSPQPSTTPTTSPTPTPPTGRLTLRCRAGRKSGRTRRVVCRVSSTYAGKARLRAKGKGTAAKRRTRALRNGHTRFRLKLRTGRTYRVKVTVAGHRRTKRLRVRD
jgi:hypothetical protein